MENLLFLGVPILKHIRVYKCGPFDRDFAIKVYMYTFREVTLSFTDLLPFSRGVYS